MYMYHTCKRERNVERDRTRQTETERASERERERERESFAVKKTRGCFAANKIVKTVSDTWVGPASAGVSTLQIKQFHPVRPAEYSTEHYAQVNG